MKRLYVIVLILVLVATSCSVGYKPYNRKRSSYDGRPPTGKYRNPTIFSRANPFQGGAKWRMEKSQAKKGKKVKTFHKQKGTFRVAPKPGRTFGRKQTLSKGRLKSATGRTKGGGGKKGNKNLFNTRKK